MLELTDERRAPLARLVAAWLVRRARDSLGEGTPPPAPTQVVVREVEVLRSGRPGLLDVLAEVDGRGVHAVLGVRPSAAEQPLPLLDEAGLGFLQDDEGFAVVVDAVRTPELAPLILEVVTGEAGVRESVVIVNDDEDATVLEFVDCSFTVFPTLADGPNRAVELLLALDDAGFNHLAAPLAVWRRGGHDLGLVQELLAGSAGGWALALTSLRDLYGWGGAPEEAGGDFGPEAQALGTMTARMHLALDRAFGHQTEPVAEWAGHVRDAVTQLGPDLLDDEDAARALRAVGLLAAAGCGLAHPRRLPPRAHRSYRSRLGGRRLPPRRPAARRGRATAPFTAGRRGRRAVVHAPRVDGGCRRA